MLGRHNFFDLQGLYRTKESLDRILAKKDIKYDESKQNKSHIYANILADLGLSEMIYEFKKLNVAIDREAIQAQNIEKNFFDLKLSTLIQREITKNLIKTVMDTFVKSKKLEEISAELRDLLAKKSEEARSRAYANALREQENQLFQKIALQLAGMNNQTLNQLSDLLNELKDLDKQIGEIKKQRAQIKDYHSTKMANAFAQFLPNAKPEELKKLTDDIIENNLPLLNDINQHEKSAANDLAQIALLEKEINEIKNAPEEVVENPQIKAQQNHVEQIENKSHNIENEIENLRLAKEAEEEAFQRNLAEFENDDNDNEDDWDVDANEDPEKSKKPSREKSPENFAAKLFLVEEHKQKINQIDNESEKLKSQLEQLKQDKQKLLDGIEKIQKKFDELDKISTVDYDEKDENDIEHEGNMLFHRRTKKEQKLEAIEAKIAEINKLKESEQNHIAKANAGKEQFCAAAGAAAAAMGHPPKDAVGFGQCALQHALPAAAALSACDALIKDKEVLQGKIRETAAQAYEQNAQFSVGCAQGMHELKSASFQGRSVATGTAAMVQIQLLHQQIQSTGNEPKAAARMNG